VRLAWFDPLGWAGLEKVVPPAHQKEILTTRKLDIQAKIQTLKEEIETFQARHYFRGVDLMAIRDTPHLQTEVNRLDKILEEERQVLAEKRRQLTIEQAKLEALEQHKMDIEDGKGASLRSHIRHAHQPQSKKHLRFSRLAEIWAAVSIGMMMIIAVLLIVFARPFFSLGLVGLVLVMVTIEAAFRRRLANLVRWISITLAIVSLLILLYSFFWYIVLAVVMITGFYMIIANLRELLARG
jgi:hypothetical protein